MSRVHALAADKRSLRPSPLRWQPRWQPRRSTGLHLLSQLKPRQVRQLGLLHRRNPPCWERCRRSACCRPSQTLVCRQSVLQDSRLSPHHWAPLPARCPGLRLRHHQEPCPPWVRQMRRPDSQVPDCPISHASFPAPPHCQTCSPWAVPAACQAWPVPCMDHRSSAGKCRLHLLLQ